MDCYFKSDTSWLILFLIDNKVFFPNMLHTALVMQVKVEIEDVPVVLDQSGDRELEDRYRYLAQDQ